MSKRKTGVSRKLVKKYEFDDHIWYQNRSNPDYSDMLSLANVSVKIGTNYWMRKAAGKHWITLGGIVDAVKEAVNTWTGAQLPSGNTIDSEMIETYFTGERIITVQVGKGKTATVKEKVGSCPNMFQRLAVPMGPQFVTYDNQQYLNTWYNDMIEPNAEDLPIGKVVLLMCYGALCDGHINKGSLKLEADRVYNMVLNNDYDNLEFRFLINWLARLYQRPGCNLLTNIWLLGEVEGLGKGTIVTIMSWLLGREFVGKLNQTEIEAGWNDHIVGKQLIEVNEFEPSAKMGPRAWGTWIKGHSIEPAFKVRQRNTTSYYVPHIGNFIFTGNEVDQRIADSNDRRNQFIRTTKDMWWVNFAVNLQQKHVIPEPERTAAGFAYILDQVQVDDKFISRAFKNEIRSLIVGNADSFVDEWFENDASITTERFILSSEMYETFKNWHRTACPGHTIPTQVTWGRKMGQHARVMKKREAAGAYYWINEHQPVEAAVTSIEDISGEVNTITGDTEITVVYDYDDPEAPRANPQALTPLEKMRAELRKMHREDQ
jgi:hypothetical protein